jgi:hypothetical protein
MVRVDRHRDTDGQWHSESLFLTANGDWTPDQSRGITWEGSHVPTEEQTRFCQSLRNRRRHEGEGVPTLVIKRI